MKATTLNTWVIAMLRMLDASGIDGSWTGLPPGEFRDRTVGTAELS